MKQNEYTKLLKSIFNINNILRERVEEKATCWFKVHTWHQNNAIKHLTENPNVHKSSQMFLGMPVYVWFFIVNYKIYFFPSKNVPHT